jgi:PmbA protein
MIAQQLVSKALKKAQGAQALVLQTEALDVLYENDLLKSTRSSQRTEITVKVMLDGKVGISSTTDIDDLDGVVARALEAAEFGSPAHFEFPGPQRATEVEIFDAAVTRLTKPEMIQIGQDMVDTFKGYGADILVGAGINRKVTHIEFANSAGVVFSDDVTDFGADTYGQRVTGTDILAVGDGFAGKQRAADHRALAQKVVEQFRLSERIVPIPSGEMPVIFTPAGMSVFVLGLWMGLNGKNVQTGASPLASKLGQRIADPRFSLIDNPLIDYAPNSSPYDIEGVTAQVTPLIEQGVVKNFLYDLETAGRMGARSTGHGSNRQPTNLIIPPGDVPYAEMIKGIREGLIVHDMLGLGQGNLIGGAFSVNIAVGYRISNGEIVGRVKDVMLAGNIYEALNQITALSQETEWPGGAVFRGCFPYVQFEKLNVVGQ